MLQVRPPKNNNILKKLPVNILETIDFQNTIVIVRKFNTEIEIADSTYQLLQNQIQ